MQRYDIDGYDFVHSPSASGTWIKAADALDRIAELEKVIKDLVYDAPCAECENMHHRKPDQGHDLGNCPVVDRWEKALDNAINLINKDK